MTHVLFFVGYAATVLRRCFGLKIWHGRPGIATVSLIAV